MEGQVLIAEKIRNLLPCEILMEYQVDKSTGTFDMCLYNLQQEAIIKEVECITISKEIISVNSIICRFTEGKETMSEYIGLNVKCPS